MGPPSIGMPSLNGKCRLRCQQFPLRRQPMNRCASRVMHPDDTFALAAF